MKRVFGILGALALAGAASVHAAPPNTPTLDGTVNVGGEWFADELVATQVPLGFDFGPQAQMTEMYVTWDATNLYIGILGNLSSTGNDGPVIYLDIDPGNFTGATNNAGGLTNTGGATNAAISNGNSTFPANMGADFAIASFFPGDGVKNPAEASNSDDAIYAIVDAATFNEGSLAGAMVRGKVNGGPDDWEISVPWADLYGGPVPANAEIGLLAFVNSTSGFSSSVYLPALTGTNPNNTGFDPVSVFTTPGLSGFLRIPVTDGGGTFLTAVNETLDSAGALSMSNVEQIFDTDMLQVSFSQGLALDANATTLGNYALTDGAGTPLGGFAITSAVVGLNGDAHNVYLTLDNPLPQGTMYGVSVSGVTANSGGASLAPATQEAGNVGWRRVPISFDSTTGEESANGINLEPFVRGEWDGFFRRSPLSDSVDAFPNIPGNQSHDTTNGDESYEGVILVTDIAVTDLNYILNAVIPNTPGSDGGADQLVGVGYYFGDDDMDQVVFDPVLLAADTSLALTDPVNNRRLIQNTTVNFTVTIPMSVVSPGDLAMSTVRMQGGTGLGGFSPENIVAPLVTGGADKGVVMTDMGTDGMGNAIYSADVTFLAGALDVTEFRFVLQDSGGVLFGDLYEQDSNTQAPGGMPPLGSVHLHVARLTEGDRVTPNDQNVSMFVSSYDVPDVIPGITPADSWNMFE